MLVDRPTEFGAVSGAPLSKFTLFPLAAEACVESSANASEGGILNVDSPAYEHQMLSASFLEQKQ